MWGKVFNYVGSVVAVVLGCIALSGAATAADLTLEVSGSGSCSDRLEGVIRDGDLEKFYSRFGYPSDADHPEAGISREGGTLCLNSPGGSFAEALDIATYLLENWVTVATQVKSGDNCASACSLIFLAGKYFEESETYQSTFDRAIEPGGKLGFHAPSLGLPATQTYTGEHVSRGFNIAIASSRRAYELSQRWDTGTPISRPFASPYVMARFLGTPPETMYYIDTVGDALLADIPAVDYRATVRLNKRLIRTICDNVYMQSDEGFGLANTATCLSTETAV